MPASPASEISAMSTYYDASISEKHAVQYSRDDKFVTGIFQAGTGVSYFPDDKIAIFEAPSPMTLISRELPSTANTDDGLLAPCTDLLNREPKPQSRFWRRYLIWIIVAAVIVVALIIGFVIGGVVANHKMKEKTEVSAFIPNNTLASVASSGVFMKDETTFNLQTFWQTSSGSIQYMMALDGSTFQKARNASLSIAPKVGSPISTTAFTDSTGLVYLSLFYISTTQQVAMCAMACAGGSSSCTTTQNNILETAIPLHKNTGLSAVSVSDSQDWRVYYHDNLGYLSELQGNASGFDTGLKVGGGAFNGSSIAAVNVNTTTNNINIFYVDMLTQSLFFQQFADGSWTLGSPVSSDRVTSFNPLSGLGAAYSSGQDQLHVYYTGLDNGIYEFLGNNASSEATVWESQPGRNHIWAEADYSAADIAAVGWNDEVRFVQQQGKVRLVQGSLSNTTWTEKFVL